MEIAKIWERFKLGIANTEELSTLGEAMETAEGEQIINQLLETDWQQLPADVQVRFSLEEPLQHIQSRIQSESELNNSKHSSKRHLKVIKPIRRVAAVLLFLIITSGIVWWQFEASQQPTVIVNNSSEVRKIDMKDGSQIWLNRNTAITYDEQYNDRIRVIKLEGEAFFSVAKNPQKPFIVQAGTVQTSVLGTAFNVRAYPNQDLIEVALVEGKVKVNIDTDTTSNFLSPGDLFAYNNANEKYITEQFEQDEPYAWRDGILVFQKATVQEVAQKLQEWYGIKFTIENEKQIQGKLVLRYDTRNVKLDEILQYIGTVMDYRFVRKTKKEIIIRPV